MPNAAAYKVFVGTWNVGAITPSNSLNLEDWLGTNRDSYDIYVLGFQEIVPLSTRNVLGPERNRVAMKWNSLIGATLNKCHRTEEENKKPREVKSEHHHKVYPMKQGGVDHVEFNCIMSKQMVGILISVWARKDLSGLIRNLCVSSVGCGIMGCLKNKGSVSVRFYLRGASFCFVCCHLSSGGKEGDQKLRNLNVTHILSKTCFAADNSSNNSPKKIPDHDHIVLFGDLNYRISLPDAKMRQLVDRKEWKTLLDDDQLSFELSPRGIFEGWNEGPINFPPTYKYKPNSDEYYYGYIYDKSKEEKRRAPAWCDRILWIGKGLKQLCYERCESKLSDHRSVRAIFLVDVEV
ncbi:type IV inositol polyphosphate 5-phosphatase 9-like [Zingiber officinale]|uniref:type IV inositol polyphosphate 5-phosphatase 9-like n=1 Tax=Zingiber officinale TaxID=94328 RepID=UPI001C4CA9CD|nr:type IV inositol polyphosphate 5-phosphatase 9-like [Zingiber officinale]XP_042398207.1 type IV inositol polyphosphate 5-phosphatase 9-like [Zingiber officinale]